jgi:hypothetical protein
MPIPGDGIPWETPVATEVPASALPPVLPPVSEPGKAAETAWEPPLAAPKGGAAPGRPGGRDPLMVTLVMESTGDGRRDARRMRRVYGLLTSYPGTDRFAFHVYESSRRYHLEFPNSTTGYCADLQAQLERLLGEGRVRVERLPIH